MHMNPSPDKYEKIKFDTYLNKTVQPMIHKTHYPRFAGVDKNAQPGPASYDTATSTDKQIKRSPTRFSVAKFKPKEFFEVIAKKNIAPGPGAHKMVESAKGTIA